MAVRERQVERVADQCHGAVRWLDLARLGQRRDHLFHAAKVIGVLVECHDVRTSAQCLERVSACTAAEVEEAVALVHLEAVVVDGQHGCDAPFAVRSA